MSGIFAFLIAQPSTIPFVLFFNGEEIILPPKEERNQEVFHHSFVRVFTKTGYFNDRNEVHADLDALDPYASRSVKHKRLDTLPKFLTSIINDKPMRLGNETKTLNEWINTYRELEHETLLTVDHPLVSRNTRKRIMIAESKTNELKHFRGHQMVRVVRGEKELEFHTCIGFHTAQQWADIDIMWNTLVYVLAADVKRNEVVEWWQTYQRWRFIDVMYADKISKFHYVMMPLHYQFAHSVTFYTKTKFVGVVAWIILYLLFCLFV